MRLTAERDSVVGHDVHVQDDPEAPPASAAAGPALERLLGVMVTLRDPAIGCPWDKEQTFATIAPYTVEEGYEVADAIARRDLSALPDELGDLLFQVVYHSQIASEQGRFTFADVTQAITDKMIRRHPHVAFDGRVGERPGSSVSSAAAQSDAWERQKHQERRAQSEAGALAGIPAGLPSLTRATKLTQRAARVGFDWDTANAVLEKLDEEIQELRDELPQADPERLAGELGDLLFVIANLARKLKLDPEDCLRRANQKFTHRFGFVERRLAEQGSSPSDATLAEMEALWQQAKRDNDLPPATT